MSTESQETRKNAMIGMTTIVVVGMLAAVALRSLGLSYAADGQNAAIKIECIKAGRAPAECDIIGRNYR